MGSEIAGTAAGRNKGRLAVVLGLTAVYLVAEVVGGLLTGSLALLADAGHMLTDVGGLAMALLAIWFAGRPATPERTYGYYRAEILAALANAVVLFAISFYIFYEAYQRFLDPPEVASGWMLLVAAIGLATVLGVLGLGAVLCFHFPSLLTMPELRGKYPVPLVRGDFRRTSTLRLPYRRKSGMTTSSLTGKWR